MHNNKMMICFVTILMILTSCSIQPNQFVIENIEHSESIDITARKRFIYEKGEVLYNEIKWHHSILEIFGVMTNESDKKINISNITVILDNGLELNHNLSSFIPVSPNEGWIRTSHRNDEFEYDLMPNERRGFGISYDLSVHLQKPEKFMVFDVNKVIVNSSEFE